MLSNMKSLVCVQLVRTTVGKGGKKSSEETSNAIRRYRRAYNDTDGNGKISETIYCFI